MENRGVLVAAVTVCFKQGAPMTDFQSFRTLVLEDDDLQEAVVSIISTATANGSGLGDGFTPKRRTFH